MTGRTATVRAISRLGPVLALGLSFSGLSGCYTLDRLTEVGDAPKMTGIQNPVDQPEYKPVALPMPRPQMARYQPNSLWRTGARAFFKDQRAARIGDILTVNITIADEAEIDNETERTRQNSEDADLTNFLGLQTQLDKVLPEAVSPANLVGLGSTSTSRGSGSVERKETITLTLAAIVTQVLPNGNLVIHGSQEVRVNFEVRIMSITGVVRPADITNTNTIRHTQIAEARISYGGRGQLTDVQQPRYGQQIFDVIFPF